MADRSRGGGCGCCGCLLGTLLLLVALFFLGFCFLYFTTTSALDRLSTRGPFPLPSTQFNRQTYGAARQKMDRFFGDPAERALILSNSEVNALLADSPELRILGRGVFAIFSQNVAEVYCSLPLSAPFLPRRYLNYSFELRPFMRGEDVVLGVSRVDRRGRPLGTVEMQNYQTLVVPQIEKLLSNMNKLSPNGAVRDVRIENGNLVLAR
jgi:hypothetical protein